MAEERTERPTQYRRRRFRERGVVAFSRDLTAAASMLGAFGALILIGPWIARELGVTCTRLLVSASAAKLTGELAGLYFRAAIVLFAKAAGPVLFGAALGALVAGWAQTGFLFSLYPLIPSAEKINPINGLKQLFSWRGLFETAKSMAKIGITLLVAWLTLAPHVPAFIGMGLEPVSVGTRRFIALATQLTLRCGLIMLLIGAADYAFQWWQTERRLMMTRRELREEWKETEGDPVAELRRRRRRREILEQRISPEMREASVVVTNPVHLAVALKYVIRAMPAPKVVAKGRGPLAQRIVDIARAYGIDVVEDVSLARSLYRSVGVGDYIPRALYQAVAEILAMIYRRRAKRREKAMSQRTSPRPGRDESGTAAELEDA